ncbi:hypothetical protein ELH44_08980 [Rhizobium ruizarguesonis]|uniref:hypothetical protein n=1 Tax=Rhizobium ruizarguesonis TaxID=2081791 RepID=UPI00102FCDAC|nr:hypothetical protein [Rhizobium ruizarguesonis]TBB53794.1 hypothetical protein ELH44_08980 [Rhizobium ruizarguesonis]
MTDELDALPTSELASIAAKCTAILAARAGGAAAAAPMVPVQLELIPPLPPIDRLTVDINERLPGGIKRWLTLQQAGGLLGCGRDAALEKALRANAAIQMGGPRSPWYVDRLRLVGLIRTQFP